MDISAIRQRGLDGKAMGEAIQAARLQLIEQEIRSAPQQGCEPDIE
jgi:hypothetical protein